MKISLVWWGGVKTAIVHATEKQAWDFVGGPLPALLVIHTKSVDEICRRNPGRRAGFENLRRKVLESGRAVLVTGMGML